MDDQRLYAPLGYREIMAEFPRLLMLRSRIEKGLLMRPYAAVLPDRFYSPDYKDSLIMGLPVIWADRYGLVLEA